MGDVSDAAVPTDRIDVRMDLPVGATGAMARQVRHLAPTIDRLPALKDRRREPPTKTNPAPIKRP
jgi:hypothetical protein